MADKAGGHTTTGDREEKLLKRNKSLEASASLNLGLGHDKEKLRYVDAFYSAVWPVLNDAGWTLAKGEGDDAGATYFFPPGIAMSSKGEGNEAAPTQTASKANPASPREEVPRVSALCGHTNGKAKSRCAESAEEVWRGGKRRPYFSKVCDVIEHILERKSAAEAKAADAYVNMVPDASDLFADQIEKIEATPQLKAEDLAWKDERTHFEKSSSRVGSEFQVDVLPLPGSYTSTASTDGLGGGPLYERVWSPEEAAKLGKLDFVHTRVKFNRRESAYDRFHSRRYRLPGFCQEVRNVSPTDCSEWTKADKDRFREAVFEKHENMKEVSEMVGKPINECITYYLVKFKRTKSYKSLQRSMKRKANLSEGTAGNLVCNECGKGGMLIACDTCEAHYHLTCVTPPLERIPDGAWNCSNCKRETRSMLSVQDDMSADVFTSVSKRGTGDAPSNGLGDIEADESTGVQKRNIDSEINTASKQAGPTEEKINTSSSHKRMRMDGTTSTAAIDTQVVPV